MKEKNTTVKATTTAKHEKRPFMDIESFKDSLIIMAQIQKEDNLLYADDEESKEIFTSLYNNQVKEIKNGKINKLLEFVGVLNGELIDLDRLYTAVQTLRIIKFKDAIDITNAIPFKTSLSIHFKTLDILQFMLRKSGINRI